MRRLSTFFKNIFVVLIFYILFAKINLHFSRIIFYWAFYVTHLELLDSQSIKTHDERRDVLADRSLSQLGYLLFHFL